MWFAPFIAPIIAFFVRELVVKFLVFTAVFGLVLVLVPVVIGYLGSFTSTGNLTLAFSNLDSGVWFFLDAFKLNLGVPLIISALVTRFVIRRMPIIG